MIDAGDMVARVLNCFPSKNTQLDWVIDHALGANILTLPDALPPQVDLREDWWTVGNQGTSGGCVGWATADSVLRWHFVKEKGLAQDQLLSARFIWMAAKELDAAASRPSTFLEAVGTSLKTALDVARKYGVVLESDLPFEPETMYQGPAETFYAIAAQHRIASYFNLGNDPASWRHWLAQRGPILVRLDVDATWDAAKPANGGQLDAYQATITRGGHCVALVGYIDDRFIMRNSWGSTWGAEGFGFASTAYAQAAFVEAYGVVV